MIPNTQPTLVDLIKTAIFSALTETHTCMPGIIDSFDASTQTATVLPAIQRLPKKAEDTPANIPPVVQVPVIFPSAGGYSITFPVAHGDEVLLIFSERALDSWQQAGGIRPPASLRHHDYTDAVAIIGLHSNPRAISGYSTESLSLRSNDGAVSLNVTHSKPTLSLTGIAGVVIPAGAVVQNGSTGETFTVDSITILGDGATISVASRTSPSATTVSEIGSISTIVTSITGWSGVTNTNRVTTEVSLDISPSGGATFNADGSVVFRNGATFNADGSVVFRNGATITALGGFVNGPAAGTVTLQSHLHNLGGNPPIAGT